MQDAPTELIAERSPLHYQYKGQYIMSAVKSGLMIIDQHRADIRIRYERYLNQLNQHAARTQRLLFPEITQFSPAENVAIQKIIPELQNIGFELSDLGGGSYAISGMPAELEGLHPVTLLQDLVNDAVAGIEETDQASDASLWKDVLAEAKSKGDSLGGVVECVVKSVPAGLGEPFFDSVESVISHAIFSIPGVRGVEFGDGFRAARMKGSEHNDPFEPAGKGWAKPVKNGAGGVNGGISNGCDIVFRVAFKPTSSIAASQKTYNFAEGKMTTLNVPGRHDVCFALRTPPIVEAMTAIVLADLSLLQ
jgi:hypothetical protein